MKMRLKLSIMILCLAFFFVFPNDFVYASELSSDAKVFTVSGPDAEGTFFYQFGSGSFNTNAVQSKACEITYLDWDDNLSISLMYNGENIAYQRGDIIYNSGDYVAIVYEKATGNVSSFNFKIENDLNITSSASSDSAGITAETIGDILNGDSSALADFQSFSENLNTEEIGVLSMDYIYDSATKAYVYAAAGKEIISASVPNGVYSSNPVVVVPAPGVNQYIYKDGDFMLSPKNYNYTEPGHYTIVSYVYEVDENKIPKDEIVENSFIYETHFDFDILDSATTYIGVIEVPLGFTFKEILHNGKNIDIPDGSYYFIDRDGEYSFTFSSDKFKDCEYSFSMKRDSVAPFLTFSKDIYSGVVKAPVYYDYAHNEEAKVSVFIDNTAIEMAPKSECYTDGWYTFIVTDEANNERIYKFYVKGNYKIISPGMLFIFISFFLVVTIYLLMKRYGEYKVDEPYIESEEINNNIDEENNDQDNH